jgi:hypothetical protein
VRGLFRKAFARVLSQFADNAGLIVGIWSADQIDAVGRLLPGELGIRLVKEEHGAAQLHLVAVMQLLHAHRGAIDVRAVGAAAVLDDEGTVDELDDGVLSRGLMVADADFVPESAADSDRLFANFEAGALIGPADHEERRLCRPGSLVRCHDDSTWLQPVRAPGGSVFRTPARRIVVTIIATATTSGPKSEVEDPPKARPKVQSRNSARKAF